MSWFAQTEEAKKQMEICDKYKCPGCTKCIWIEESGWAMVNYGTVKVVEHPLKNKIIKKFNGKIIK